MNALKILVVDDESDLEFLITKTFKKRIQAGELRFLFAENGQEALRHLQADAEILVVVSDIRMPHMDGLTLLAHLTEHYPLVCPVIITAYSDMKNIRTAMNRGTYDFLTKPLNLDDLESTLDKAIRHITGIMQVFTERKQAEEALTQERNLLRTIIDAIPDYIYVKDTQGRFLLNNEASLRALGSPPDVAGKTDFDFFPEELAEQYSGDEQKVFQTGQSLINREECNLNQEMGETRWVLTTKVPFRDHQGNIIGLVGINRDITELKQAQEALEASHQQYRSLVEKVADGIAVFQEDKPVFVNEVLCPMLGDSSNQLSETKLAELLLDDENHDVPHPSRLRCVNTDEHHPLLGGAKGGFSSETHDVQRKKPDGTRSEPVKQDSPEQPWHVKHTTREGREIWLETYQSKIQWEGKPALLITVRDITEHKLHEIMIEQEEARLVEENLALKGIMKDRNRFGDIVGRSPAMQQVYALIVNAARSDQPVLIFGESGTGKELVAKTIHRLSNRSDHTFIPVNCGAIPDGLFENEFFGHRRGSFTGAQADKPGLFDRAHLGTLFLDEIAELDLEEQVKFFRVLETGEYKPVGGTSLGRSDARIIAATSRDLIEMMNVQKFRVELFYRLHVIEIRMPPLRECKEDIPLLIDYFLEHFGQRNQILPTDVLNQLYAHSWPGNVRELQNVLWRYVTTGQLVFASKRDAKPVTPSVNPGLEGNNLAEAMKNFEKQFITQVLDQYNGHRVKTAIMLGITERSLYRKIQQYQIN